LRIPISSENAQTANAAIDNAIMRNGASGIEVCDKIKVINAATVIEIAPTLALRVLAYEQMRKMDPDATWFLHVGKKMLLNGSTKNPDMKPTKLSLPEIIKVLEGLYA
jgi:hypothetical protein